MDKAEWDARANAGSIKRIAAALRARDEEIARLKALCESMDISKAAHDQLRAERDACVAALADYAKHAADSGWHNLAEEIRRRLAQLPHAALRARLVDAVVAAARTLSDLIRWDDKQRRYTIEGHDDIIGALLSELRLKQRALGAFGQGGEEKGKDGSS